MNDGSSDFGQSDFVRHSRLCRGIAIRPIRVLQRRQVPGELRGGIHIEFVPRIIIVAILHCQGIEVI